MSANAQAVSLVISPAPDHCCWVGSASPLTLKSQSSKTGKAAQAWGAEVAFIFSKSPRVAAPPHSWSPYMLNEYVCLQGHRKCLEVSPD